MSDIKSYDELIKLKELLDMGIITEDEFSAKKRKILGIDISETNDNKSDKQEETSMNLELISCPGCGRKVSRMAEACPGCGYPIEDYIYDLEIEEEEQKQKELIEKIKKSDEYKALSDETTFDIGTINVSASKNMLIISDIVNEFDGIVKTVLDNIYSITPDEAWNQTLVCDGWFDCVVELDVGYDGSYEHFAELILKKSMPLYYKKISELVRKYVSENKKNLTDDIYSSVVDEEQLLIDIKNKIETTCETIKDVAQERYDRAEKADIAIHDYSSRIDKVYSESILGMLVGNVTANLIDAAGATAHFLKYKNEYINSHKGLNEFMFRVHNYADSVFNEYLNYIVWEIKESIVEELVKRLAKNFVISEETIYTRQSYKEHLDILDGQSNIQEQFLFDNSVVEKIYGSVLKRNLLNEATYADILIYGDYNIEQTKSICNLIEYSNKKDEVFKLLNHELLLGEFGWSYKIDDIEKNKIILKKQETWVDKRQRLVRNLTSVWPDIKDLKNFINGEKTELDLFNEHKRCLETMLTGFIFHERFGKYYSIINQTLESRTDADVIEKYNHYSKEFESWFDMREAIYIENDYYNDESIYWGKYSKYFESWFVLTSARFATNDFSIDLSEIYEMGLFDKIEYMDTEVYPLFIECKDTCNVTIPSGCNYAEKKDGRIIVYFDRVLIREYTGRFYELAGIALENNIQKGYERKYTNNAYLCANCLTVSRHDEICDESCCPSCKSILLSLKKQGKLSNNHFVKQYLCRKKVHDACPEYGVLLDELENNPLSEEDFIIDYYADGKQKTENFISTYQNNSSAWHIFSTNDNFNTKSGINSKWTIENIYERYGVSERIKSYGKTDVIYNFLGNKTSSDAKAVLNANYIVQYQIGIYKVRFYFDEVDSISAIGYLKSIDTSNENINGSIPLLNNYKTKPEYVKRIEREYGKTLPFKKATKRFVSSQVELNSDDLINMIGFNQKDLFEKDDEVELIRVAENGLIYETRGRVISFDECEEKGSCLVVNLEEKIIGNGDGYIVIDYSSLSLSENDLTILTDKKPYDFIGKAVSSTGTARMIFWIDKAKGRKEEYLSYRGQSLKDIVTKKNVESAYGSGKSYKFRKDTDRIYRQHVSDYKEDMNKFDSIKEFSYYEIDDYSIRFYFDCNDILVMYALTKGFNLESQLEAEKTYDRFYQKAQIDIFDFEDKRIENAINLIKGFYRINKDESFPNRVKEYFESLNKHDLFTSQEVASCSDKSFTIEQFCKTFDDDRYIGCHMLDEVWHLGCNENVLDNIRKTINKIPGKPIVVMICKGLFSAKGGLVITSEYVCDFVNNKKIPVKEVKKIESACVAYNKGIKFVGDKETIEFIDNDSFIKDDDELLFVVNKINVLFSRYLNGGNENTDLVPCKKCGKSINQSAKFCAFCGEKTTVEPTKNDNHQKACTKCGKYISDSAKFCNFCGEKIDVESQKQEKSVGTYIIDTNEYGSEW